MSPPAPGWYPTGDGRYWRYHDGHAWTSHVAPAPPAAPVRSRSGLSSVSDFVSTALKVAWGQGWALLAINLVVWAPVGVAVMVAAVATGADLEVFLTADSDAGPDQLWEEIVPWLLVGAVAAVGYLAAVPVSLAASTHQIDRAHTASPVPWTESLAVGVRRAPLLVAVYAGLVTTLSVVVAVAVVAAVVAFTITPALGVIVVIAALAGLPVLWWAGARMALLVPAVTLSPSRRGVIARSWQLTRGRLWAVLARLVVFALIVGCASAAADMGLSALTFLPVPALVAVGFALRVLVSLLSTGAQTAGMVVLYRELEPVSSDAG